MPHILIYNKKMLHSQSLVSWYNKTKKGAFLYLNRQQTGNHRHLIEIYSRHLGPSSASLHSCFTGAMKSQCITSIINSWPLNFLVGSVPCRKSPTGKYWSHFQIRTNILPLILTRNWKQWLRQHSILDTMSGHQATNQRTTASDCISMNDLLIFIYKRLGQWTVSQTSCPDRNITDVRVWTRPRALWFLSWIEFIY